MSTLEEKRVYGGKQGRTEAFVATEVGLAAVQVAGDRVGGFSLVHRESARDVAAAGDAVAAATEGDVLVREGDGEFEPTDFGPATAVGFDGETLVAAGEERVARFEDEWVAVGTIDAPVRALSGDLAATADGVYRLAADALQFVGLDAVADVSAPGVPLAATDAGLYKLGNGWMTVREGTFHAVSADPAAEPGRLGRAHAAGDRLLAHRDGEWVTVDLPVDAPVVDIAYGEGVYAVTRAGTFLVDAGEGWRAHPLGLAGARALALG